MALQHAPFALCVAETNPSQSPSVSCNLPMPLVMKDDMHQHQQPPGQQHLHDYERLSKLPANGKSAWSDTATECLIEVFEEKWNSLRRGNLKAKNWDEVGVELGNRCGVPKTGDQCRHKIEKLRGRFRQEKVLSNFNHSKWPWYDRLNLVFGDRVRLLRDAASLDKAVAVAAEARSQQQGQRGSHQVNSHREDRTNQLELLHHQLQQQQQHYQPQEAAEENPPASNAAGAKHNETSFSSQSRESTDGESRERRKRARTASSESDLPAFVKGLNDRMEDMQREYDKLRSEVEARAAQMQQVELKRTEMLVQMEIRRTQLVYEVTKMQMDFLETLLRSSRAMNHNSSNSKH